VLLDGGAERAAAVQKGRYKKRTISSDDPNHSFYLDLHILVYIRFTGSTVAVAVAIAVAVAVAGTRVIQSGRHPCDFSAAYLLFAREQRHTAFHEADVLAIGQGAE